MDQNQGTQNTDRTIYIATGDGSEDTIHVTADGGIGFKAGGRVIVMPLREWHRLGVLYSESLRPPPPAPYSANTPPRFGNMRVLAPAFHAHARLRHLIARIDKTNQTVTIDYTNHRGERRLRVIREVNRLFHDDLRFGNSEWHSNPQWILRAYDVEKSVVRDFALAGIHAWDGETIQPDTEFVEHPAQIADPGHMPPEPPVVGDPTNVHTPDPQKWNDLIRERDAARADVFRLIAALEEYGAAAGNIHPSAPSSGSIDRLHKAIDTADRLVARIRRGDSETENAT